MTLKTCLLMAMLVIAALAGQAARRAKILENDQEISLGQAARRAKRLENDQEISLGQAARRAKISLGQAARRSKISLGQAARRAKMSMAARRPRRLRTAREIFLANAKVPKSCPAWEHLSYDKCVTNKQYCKVGKFMNKRSCEGCVWYTWTMLNPQKHKYCATKWWVFILSGCLIGVFLIAVIAVSSYFCCCRKKKQPKPPVKKDVEKPLVEVGTKRPEPPVKKDPPPPPPTTNVRYGEPRYIYSDPVIKESRVYSQDRDRVLVEKRTYSPDRRQEPQVEYFPHQNWENYARQDFGQTYVQTKAPVNPQGFDHSLFQKNESANPYNPYNNYRN